MLRRPAGMVLALFMCLNGAAELSFTGIHEEAGLPHIDGGHGAAWCDADGDGFADLYITLVVNGCTPEHARRDLFLRSQGGVTFREDGGVLADDNDGGSHGAAWVDLDNDGDYDLINGGTVAAGTGFCKEGLTPTWNDLYRNDGAKGFVRVTPPLLAGHEALTRAFIALDWDRDGDLDLFGVQGGQSHETHNELYQNDGGFQFSMAAESDAQAASDAQQGATDTDFDGDGDVDIITAGAHGPVLLRNDGNGAFTRVDTASVGLPTGREANDGVTTADVDNDGDLDILLVEATPATGNRVGGRLYLNEGNGHYALHREFRQTNGYTGGFADLDNDGDLDLVFAGDDVAYVNDGGGGFTAGPAVPDLGALMGYRDYHNDPRAIAFADMDNDGDLDFAAATKHAPRNLLIRNDYRGGNHWIRIRLISPQGQAGAFGAKTRVYAASDKSFLGLRESKSNYGYLAQDEPILHFGLGKHAAVDVVVTFLDGTVMSREGVKADQILTLDGRQARANGGRSGGNGGGPTAAK